VSSIKKGQTPGDIEMYKTHVRLDKGSYQMEKGNPEKKLKGKPSVCHESPGKKNEIKKEPLKKWEH